MSGADQERPARTSRRKMNMVKTLSRHHSLRPYLVHWLVVTLCLLLALLLKVPGTPPASAVQSPQQSASAVPDFADIGDVEVRKEAFFSFLQPHIDRVNGEILTLRTELERLQGRVRSGVGLTRQERAFISHYTREYEVEPEQPFGESHLETLLRRVDIIPSSLVLAQAANESAWGTSRFAVEGNNFFGQWCFSDGCGLVPTARPSDADHEVRMFSSPVASVRAYFHNLNTFTSYRELREIRARLRARGRPIDGISLSRGLQNYSERGQEYIEELQSMILFNNLQERDSADV